MLHSHSKECATVCVISSRFQGHGCIHSLCHCLAKRFSTQEFDYYFVEKELLESLCRFRSLVSRKYCQSYFGDERPQSWNISDPWVDTLEKVAPWSLSSGSSR